MLKKTISLMVVIAMMLSVFNIAFATTSEDDGGATDYTYISSTLTNLEITSAGKACCAATITCYSGTDSNRISAYLQRNVSGSWITVQNWSKTTTGSRGSLYKEYYVTSGYQYRLRVYYYAYEGSNTESTTGTDYYTY